MKKIIAVASIALVTSLAAAHADASAPVEKKSISIGATKFTANVFDGKIYNVTSTPATPASRSALAKLAFTFGTVIKSAKAPNGPKTIRVVLDSIAYDVHVFNGSVYNVYKQGSKTPLK